MTTKQLCLKELTKEYVKCFHSKDLQGVASLLHETFVLEDPVVKRVSGKQASLAVIDGLFKGCDKLSFKARNIFEDGNTTIIEFELKLDDTTLTGTDIIEWDNGQMHEMRAYLDVPK
ncbi:MAG: nuclear transport factor 2 family protein [Chlamydiales bacterium]|nr:nuclear transport factor 2 family protein [Chlamydiales bacterium]